MSIPEKKSDSACMSDRYLLDIMTVPCTQSRVFISQLARHISITSLSALASFRSTPSLSSLLSSSAVTLLSPRLLICMPIPSSSLSLSLFIFLRVSLRPALPCLPSPVFSPSRQQTAAK